MPPSPYQDFRTYTEVDPANRLTVDTEIITATNLTMDDHALVYRDKGLNHFGPTWEHKLKTTCDHTAGKTQNWGLAGTWAIANTIANMNPWVATNAEAITLYWQRQPPNITINLRDFRTGHTDTHDFGPAIAIVTTYPTIQRTSETNVRCRLYSDSARTILVDTLTIAITSGDRHRYIYGLVSYDNGNANQKFYGTSEHLLL